MMFPTEIIARLRRTRVVAGFSVDKAEHAVPIARALLAGGIDAIELLLRTPDGLAAVEAICADVPEILVGVGTILTPDTMRDVKNAGADFGVAPGLNANVIRAARDAGLPFAPGIATPSDLEASIELGCRFVKLFPAESLGGIGYLRSMSAPYSHLGIEYFPLGGINADNMSAYLAEPNVVAVGGSWIVKKELVAQEDWTAISARAKEVTQAVQIADQ
ncbi:Putative KHG/KDPG aldolase [Stieleria maiorica]|uniref:KHG/KDPG aldolase n=1 Tax=Stieleria maiorica TaxID=2795974 RepID=A0A5B9MPV1_9BACT|nr:bifunctional 4-hydroxy-2-oxoglutarate aldolase/2-dehydro-3-deoxy-phosphogluconate aldolase [Stieleria maiorica]QEG02410.1 Putative KHG/KDPG aldolase [Stieleria maiorica]